jgi:hypothetical protein
MSKRQGRKRSKPHSAAVERSDQEYPVGPGHPPKEYQFKPGQSGNPKGGKRKPPSMAPDLKMLLERALNQKIKLKRGEREKLMTKGAAGIANLVDEFAAGDRHAWRDLIALAGKLGIDLTAGQGSAIERMLGAKFSVDDQALVDDYVRRRNIELNYAPDNSDDAPEQSIDPHNQAEGEKK